MFTVLGAAEPPPVELFRPELTASLPVMLDHAAVTLRHPRRQRVFAAAAKAVGVKVPIVVRLEGTNVEKGREILASSGLAFRLAEGMRDAAEKVVAAAAGR